MPDGSRFLISCHNEKRDRAIPPLVIPGLDPGIHAMLPLARKWVSNRRPQADLSTPSPGSAVSGPRSAPLPGSAPRRGPPLETPTMAGRSTRSPMA